MRRRLYQRACQLAAAMLIVAGCSRATSPTSVPARPAVPPAPALLLAGSRYELAGAGGPPVRLLADHIQDGRHRAELIPGAGGSPLGLLPPGATSSHALALAPDGGAWLVEGRGGTHRTLWIGSDRGFWAALRALGEAPERFLFWSADGATVWSAANDESGLDHLVETSRAGGERRSLFTAPAGFRIAAVDASARRVAMVHRIDAQATEVVLHDRSSGDGRLLLPDGKDGDFQPLGFTSGGESLLLLADDGRADLALEKLDLASHERRPFGELPCPPRSGRPQRDGSWVVVISCDGARQAVRLDANGARIADPELPRGSRMVAAVVAPGGLAVAAAGPGWPADLDWIDAAGLARPLTYGLEPRVDPASVPLPRSAAVASAGGIDLPAEIWPAATPVRGAVVWLDPRRELPRWLEHEPLPAALASAGIAVLHVRSRGSEGFGTQLRTAAGDDPDAAVAADAIAARRKIAAELPAARGIALVGDGPDSARVALLAAADRATAWAGVAALGPGAPEAPEVPPNPDTAGAKPAPVAPPPWPPLLEPIARPLLLVLDPAGTGETDLAAAARAAATADPKLSWIEPDDDAPGTPERRLFDFLVALFAAPG